MNRSIEAIQTSLGRAQQRLSCTEDAVVDFIDAHKPGQIRRARSSIATTIAALERADKQLARLEN
jgi:hypothetical protein